MIPNNLTRADLADFIQNAATQVGSGAVTGLIAEQVVAFSTALEADAIELAAAEAERVALRAASIAATRKAQDIERRALKHVQNLRYAMKSVGSGAAEFNAVGFDPPARVRRHTEPQTPTEVAVKGFSNGVNAITFAGNNRPNSVRYIIEARVGHSAAYTMVGVSRSQTFKHTGVMPGIPHDYRIRAQTTRGRLSDYSNEAVVYRL